MEIEDEKWFLDTSKKLVGCDVFAARSWLLTAKCLFPQSFQLQMEEYLLELSRENTEECSKILNDIFREFSNETAVWDEIEKLIQAVEHSSDPLRKAIFDDLPSLTQQRMLLASAESRVNIAQYCRLLIVLMKKFPETVSQFGMKLTERLVDAEKKDPEGTPVNHYRKLLVCDVLPVICHIGKLGVSLKHFYKWLQKATEFYVCYYTSENETNVSNAWSDMEKLRTDIAIQCSWNEDKGTNRPSTLSDRVAFMKELFRRSRTDVDGAVNRKQIFYTTLILLFEASSVYVENLCSSIYRDTGKEEESLVVMIDIDDAVASDEDFEQLPARKSSALDEAFLVAKESWNILHANETYEKDLNHLIRRWKCERWTWFQLFLGDLNIQSGNLELAVEILTQVEQHFDKERIRHEIKIRTYTSLVFVCYSLGLYKESCEFIFNCISLLSRDGLNITFMDHVTNLNKPAALSKIISPFQTASNSGRPLLIVRPTVKQLLPLWVMIFLKSLQTIPPAKMDDSVLGHILVLSQHRWPFWKSHCDEVLKIVEEKQSFTFEHFLQFVINVDILEEVAFLKRKKSCQLTITNQATKSHVTRGANREADDEFWKAIKVNIQRSDENVNTLLANYLTSNKLSLVSALDKIGLSG